MYFCGLLPIPFCMSDDWSVNHIFIVSLVFWFTKACLDIGHPQYFLGVQTNPRPPGQKPHGQNPLWQNPLRQKPHILNWIVSYTHFFPQTHNFWWPCPPPPPPPWKRPSEKIVGKGENAGNQHFLLFLQGFILYAFSQIEFLVCKCFQIGQIQNVVVW